MSEIVAEGEYYRFGIFNERHRFRAALLQTSSRTHPVGIIDSDWTDQARIHMRAMQRFAQLFSQGAKTEEDWKPTGNDADPVNNFLIQGGDSTAEGAAVALVGGERALLFEDTDFKCTNGGDFNLVAAFQIHHRYTSVAAGELVDKHAKWGVDKLVGLTVRINSGGGSFPITANTQNTLTLGGGFDPVASPPPADDHFYYFELDDPAVDAVQGIYLDVHYQDFGAADNSVLNHNPGGSTVEYCRRVCLIQQVWVEQVVGQQPTASYVDTAGARHYVFKLGTVSRTNGDDNLVDDDFDDGGRNNNIGTPEVVAAREYGAGYLCVEDEDQPGSLGERLERDHSWVTVGDGTNNFGQFNGAQGILDALACQYAKIIFVKTGAYNFSGLGQIDIPAGKTLMGESRAGVILTPDNDLGLTDSQIRVRSGAHLTNVTVVRSAIAQAVPVVAVSDTSAALHRVSFTDQSTTAVCVRIHGANPWGVTISDCVVVKETNTAILVDPTHMDYASDNKAVAGSSRITLRENMVVQSNGPVSNATPAVVVQGGWPTTVRDNWIASDSACFKYAGSGMPALIPLSSDYREHCDIGGNVFAVSTQAGLGAGGVAAVWLNGGSYNFEGNFVETQLSSGAAVVGDLPLYGVYVSEAAGGKGNRGRVANNYVRGARNGIRLENLLYAEIDCSGNRCLPYSTDLGMLRGIWVVSGVTLSFLIELVGAHTGMSQLPVRDNMVFGSSDTIAHIDIDGVALVEGNLIFGGLNTDADIESAEETGFGIRYQPAGTARDAVIRGNHIYGAGNVGIYCVGPGGGYPSRAVVVDNVVEQANHGILTTGMGGEHSGNRVARITYSAVRFTSVPGGQDAVSRGNFCQQAGSASYAVIQGGSQIIDNTVEDRRGTGIWTVGVDPGSGAPKNATVRGNKVSSTGQALNYGILTTADGIVEVCGNDVTVQSGDSSAIGIAVSTATQFKIENNNIVDQDSGFGVAGEGILLTAVQSGTVCLNSVRMGTGAYAAAVLYIGACSGVEITDNYFDLRGDGPAIARGAGGSLSYSSFSRNKVFAVGSEPIALTEVAIFQFNDNVIEDDAPTLLSALDVGVSIAALVLNDYCPRSVFIATSTALTDLEIRGNVARHGICVQEAHGASAGGRILFEDNVCDRLGAVVLPWRSSVIAGGNKLKGKATSISNGTPVDKTALWVGPWATADLTEWYVTVPTSCAPRSRVVNNDLEVFEAVGLDLGSAALRSAGAMLHLNAASEVLDNRVRADSSTRSFGIILGNIYAANGDKASRQGSVAPISALRNTFYNTDIALLLVCGLSTTAASGDRMYAIKDNIFVSGTTDDSAAYSSRVGVWIAVPAAATQFVVVVRGNDTLDSNGNRINVALPGGAGSDPFGAGQIAFQSAANEAELLLTNFIQNTVASFEDTD